MIRVLNLAERITFTPAQLAVKAKVDAYEHPGVIWKLKTDHGMSEDDAAALFADVKDFLFCIYMKQDTEFAMVPTPVLDKAWHELILFTLDYGPFCLDTFGYFIHHIPDEKIEGARCSDCGIRCKAAACGSSADLPGQKKGKIEGPQSIRMTIAHASAVLGELSLNWSFGMHSKMNMVPKLIN